MWKVSRSQPSEAETEKTKKKRKRERKREKMAIFIKEIERSRVKYSDRHLVASFVQTKPAWSVKPAPA